MTDTNNGQIKSGTTQYIYHNLFIDIYLSNISYQGGFSSRQTVTKSLLFHMNHHCHQKYYLHESVHICHQTIVYETLHIIKMVNLTARKVFIQKEITSKTFKYLCNIILFTHFVQNAMVGQYKLKGYILYVRVTSG